VIENLEQIEYRSGMLERGREGKQMVCL